MASSSTKVPTAFVSYAWESEVLNSWVRDFAAQLRQYGVDVTLDQWHAAPGDQLPAFMERAVRAADYVLIICTPKYKAKSEGRHGGVGYEGDIMTAEIMSTGNQRKFIPVLRYSDWAQSAPSWLAGKYYVDLRGDPYSEAEFNDLTMTMAGQRPVPPPLGTSPLLGPTAMPKSSVGANAINTDPPVFLPIHIEGIIVDEVGVPLNDGSPGSALYAVPFKLSRTPPSEWAKLFVKTWDHPPSFTTMHRPRIAEIDGDRLVLNGTTIDEVGKVHRETLKIVLKEVNSGYSDWVVAQLQREEAQRQQEEQNRNHIRDAAKRIKFDDFT